MTIKSIDYCKISTRSMTYKTLWHTSKTCTVGGSATISTAQSKFGGSSLALPGSGTYLAIPSSADFAFGTGDFTFEGWYYFTTVTGTYIWEPRSSGVTAVPTILYETASTRFAYYVNNAYRITATFTITPGTWYHIALSRTGTSTKLFVDGVQRGSTYTDTVNYVQPSTSYIGRLSGSATSDNMNGYVDDVRITKGVGRYTANFTPPASAHIGDQYTKLLLHFDGTNGSTTIIDDNL